MTTTDTAPIEATKELTSADIADWMIKQLAKVHEKYAYGQVTVSINQYGFNAAVPKFAIYCGKDQPESRDCLSIEECFEDLSKQTPLTRAAAKREAAAKLLAEAEAIEAQAANLQHQTP